jgi:hypothetical protein
VTGPTGAASTIAGPTGPTGSLGPTGPSGSLNTFLPVLTYALTTVQVAIAGGYLAVVNFSGSTINVPVY